MKDKNYWFSAKRYGWGWGPPVTWQGWAILIAFLVLVIMVGPLIFNPVIDMAGYLTYVAMLTFVFIAICWWKGEKPAWRWGDKKDNS